MVMETFKMENDLAKAITLHNATWLHVCFDAIIDIFWVYQNRHDREIITLQMDFLY